ncbi:MAG: 2-methylcitrate dehydratase PrpD [Candidatus Alkanophagales archaeon MCA70_species_2]|nr:2-methylcitrate dehydratase PrpD [Candidatus Alkanophaga liquidiphilum]
MERFASWLAALEYEDVPLDVRERAKMCLLDWACISVYGARSPRSKILVDIFKEEAGKPESMILVHGYMVPCENAAMTNAVMAASYELCDSLPPPAFLSPGAAVISAAVAVAERERCSGRELMTAIIAGYEVCGRVGDALKAAALPLSVVAAVGKLLGLGEDELEKAFALASRTVATGDTTHYNEFATGMAARNSILCAVAAKKGFGRKAALGSVPKLNENDIEKQLGERWVMREVGFKYFGCRHSLHGYLDAALRLMRDYGIKAEDVEYLKVKIPRNHPFLRDACNDAKKSPKSLEDAQNSLPFCLATVFHDGHLLDPARQLSDERFKDQRILQLASKLRVEIDKKLDAVMERGGVLLSPLDIKAAGRAFAMAAPCKGFKGNPLSYEELERKFFALTQGVIAEEDLENLVYAINGIENVDDISDVIELLIAEEEGQEG